MVPNASTCHRCPPHIGPKHPDDRALLPVHGHTVYFDAALQAGTVHRLRGTLLVNLADWQDCAGVVPRLQLQLDRLGEAQRRA